MIRFVDFAEAEPKTPELRDEMDVGVGNNALVQVIVNGFGRGRRPVQENLYALGPAGAVVGEHHVRPLVYPHRSFGSDLDGVVRV